MKAFLSLIVGIGVVTIITAVIYFMAMIGWAIAAIALVIFVASGIYAATKEALTSKPENKKSPE
jgi:hypothetical protein